MGPKAKIADLKEARVTCTGNDGILPAGRNRRTVWNIATQPTPFAHFATFPEKLVEPCIKAGTSERGVCAECGAGWVRVVETDNPRSSEDYRQRKTTPKDIASNGLGGRGTKTSGLAKPGWRKDGVTKTTTTGWQPACTCNADTKPAIVLDPFAGSGTTGLVARRLGRRFVGLDLSFEYLQTIARRRLSLDALDEWANGIKTSELNTTGLPLFEEMP